MSRFQAVIFDLDGVLADTASAHYLAWKAIADELGVPFDEAANEAIKGVDRMGSLDAILAPSGLRLSAAEKQAIATRKNDLYLAAITRLGPEDLLLPGADDLVAAVRREGLRCAVASASRNAPLVLDRAGLATAFDHVADPSRNRPKPAPDLFLECARMVGVDPQNCVGLEDSAAGLTAIAAAGMRAIGIGDPRALGQADQVYPATAAVDLQRVLAA